MNWNEWDDDYWDQPHKPTVWSTIGVDREVVLKVAFVFGSIIFIASLIWVLVAAPHGFDMERALSPRSVVAVCSGYEVSCINGEYCLYRIEPYHHMQGEHARSGTREVLVQCYGSRREAMAVCGR